MPPQRVRAADAQVALWDAAKELAETPLLTRTWAFRLRGSVSEAALRSSVRKLGERHELLHAVFEEHDSELALRPVVAAPLRVETPGRVPTTDAELRAIAATEARRPFQLESEPLFRTVLFRLGEEDHLLVLTAHSLIWDRRTRDIVLKELSELYASATTGRPPRLPEISKPYSEIAARIQNAGSDRRQADFDWWLARLASVRGMRLPADLDGSLGDVARTGIARLHLGDPADRPLAAALREHRATPFALFAAALAGAVHCYTGESDMRVGTVIGNRLAVDSLRIVGPLSQATVLRFGIATGMTFGALLHEVQRCTFEAFEHQSVSFIDVLLELEDHGVEPDMLAPLTVSDIGQGPVLSGWRGVTVAPVEIEFTEATSLAPGLDLAAHRTETGYRLQLAYNESLFSQSRARAILRAVHDVAGRGLADPTAPVTALCDADQHRSAE
jgi:hypothetical protein